MLKLDTLSQLKQLKQDIKSSRNLSEGKVKGSAHKFGFVTLDSGKDVYLPPDEMEKVLPGDRVEVEIIKDAKNKKVAKLERLIESQTTVFCGKYITKGKTHFIEPDITGMSRWFFVPPQKRKNAQAKDLVKCKVTQHPYKTGKAQAAVIEVIGTDQDIDIERKYACQKYKLPTDWNPSIDEQLSQIDEALIQSLKPARTDYTHIPFVTVDAASTTDIDDALYAEENAQGLCLYVAIADPCALIKEHSAIEKEALNRSNSVYFPAFQIPMLPEKLAADVCSLVEGKERLAKVLKIQLNSDGSLIDYKLDNGVIKSRLKMSYLELSSFLTKVQTGDLDIEDGTKTSLALLEKIGDALLNDRKNNALIQPDRTEFYLELNEQQKIAEIKPKEISKAHRIIEESMVLANRCIADLLKSSKLNSIFVRHAGVRGDRIEALNKVLNENITEYQDSDIASLEGFIKTSRLTGQSDELKDYQLLVSRQLEKSTLSSEAGPHFGMGIAAYTNFTSPLRKAHDLLIHRQLDSILSGQPQAIDPSLLPRIEQNSSNSKGAVYDVEQWLKCQYLAKRKDTFDARIQRAFSTGFQVRLVDNGIEGFVSTKEMAGKYSFNQDKLTLTGKGVAYKLDQLIQVNLKQVDWSRKQLQFDVVSSPE
jgi:ribonuclease R